MINTTHFINFLHQYYPPERITAEHFPSGCSMIDVVLNTRDKLCIMLEPGQIGISRTDKNEFDLSTVSDHVFTSNTTAEDFLVRTVINPAHMQYYTLMPEVSGQLGPNSVLDTTTHPPKVTHLHFIFDGWLGDGLIECFPCFLVNEQLALEIDLENYSGCILKDAEVEYPATFQANIHKPRFKWLHITGTLGDDLFIDDEHYLNVSGALYEAFKWKEQIANCEVRKVAEADLLLILLLIKRNIASQNSYSLSKILERKFGIMKYMPILDELVGREYLVRTATHPVGVYEITASGIAYLDRNSGSLQTALTDRHPAMAEFIRKMLPTPASPEK